MTTAPHFDLARYTRQMIHPAIGDEGQRALGAARVLLVGCGALGTHIADTLTRAGVGMLRIVDRDFVELHNLQRQVLFDEDDLAEGTPKALAAAQKLRRINSTVTIEAVVDDANASNITALLDSIDLILDGTDNFETRYLLNDAAVRAGLPWIYGGVLATYGMTMTILPGETACLRCVFPDPPPAGAAPTCETAGVLGPAVAAIAALEATEAIKVLVGAREAINRELLALDVWRLTLDRLPAARQATCPACGDGAHTFPFLDPATASRTVALCGRNAVQITLAPPTTLPLPALAERLRPVGAVRYNAHLLRFQPVGAGQELVIFPNGRAIVHGTDDPALAKTLYARYVGM
ncbi:MAG TPA: ThiF family adenylyltransferase [Thermomicrobiales bacterium]|jgi:adenylyltransferase/sulfurtransferase|nr:ThiF family adenylyltransferase [Thermomicrobiales bacterium]